MPRRERRQNNSALKKVPTLRRGRTMHVAGVALNKSAHQTGRNSIRFRETERILTIVGSQQFENVAAIALNPGLSGSFPWLSGHAVLFENYKVHKICYRYKNLKGTSASGNVLMSFDYDTTDPSPETAIEATQATHYVDGAPWRLFQLNVPTDGRKLFTRSGEPLGSDLKTYDMGKLHISTEGCADTTVHGYLECEYDIEFFNKQTATLDQSSTKGTAYGYSGDILFPSGSSMFKLEELTYTMTTPSVNPVPTSYGVQLSRGYYNVEITASFINGVVGASVSYQLKLGAVTLPQCPQQTVSTLVVAQERTVVIQALVHVEELGLVSQLLQLYITFSDGANVVNLQMRVDRL